ncbi:efflux RND transporter permease subunit [Tepidanaerobacter sp. GT38]|uniref:efflux RND transporter permease subunit n=1 Tax=Tepidanaerobacter sp. GT38 TaxID=2722793 RepID=UPI001F2E1BD2|nr:efflux RND transporter permease subunit [Tepidanaerobacter sp. GT38]MCG1013281.1 efflux RND transporter permease subunit [Tepidanaerobacter sp. GT38]
MNLARFSIKRPVTTLMIIAVVLVLGFISFSRLGIDLFPEFSFPVGVVMTQYQGASSHEVENLITKPLEQVLSTMNNVKNIQSLSSEGNSTIIVEFNWGTNMDIATQDIREKIDLIEPYLPSDAKAPMIVKFDPSMMPVMQIALYGSDDIVQLKEIAEDVIESRLLRIEGVASVGISGGLERQIAISVDPDKLSFYGLSMPQLASKLQMENINLPGGNVNQGKKQYNIRTQAEFEDISEIENMPIPLPQGGTIPLKSIAKVEDTYKDISTIARYNGKPSIALTIQKQSGYNTVQVAKKVKSEMAKIAKEIPVEIGYEMILDQSDFIEFSINNVKNNAITGGIIAVMVIYLFLQNLRSTLVIGLSIPISIIATFVLVYFSNITLNMMSLGGLALGIGMLVDNSIVVLENIYSHRIKGKDPETAAIWGTNEVAMAITASTLTTVAVFLPIVFVQGMTAQLFKQLALTVTFSLLSSLFVALTIVPLLSSRLMTQIDVAEIFSEEDSKKGILSLLKKFKDLYVRVEQKYSNLLKWSLTHRKAVIIPLVMLFVISMALVPLIGAEFLPHSDAGSISISVKLPYGTNLDETDRFVSELVDRIKEIPEIEGIMESIGSAGGMAGLSGSDSSEASITLQLVPLNERQRSAEEVAEEIRKITMDMAGAEIKVRAVSSMDFAGGGSLESISIEISGDDLDELDEIAREVSEIVKATPGAREVKTSLDEGKPELVIKIDRDKATMYGLTSAQIAQTINSAISGSVATKYKVGGDEIDVVIKSDKELVDDISKVQDLLIPSATGAFLTLRDVAKVEKSTGPVSIVRQNQARQVTVTGTVVGRDIGTVNREIQQKLNELHLPEGYSIKMGGEQEQMMESFSDMLLVFVLAVILVYMVMAAQFESLKHPFVIMFTVPLALIGVVLALLLTGHTINIISLIGVIMLAGIVVNNAIVLIDFINQLRESGMSRNEAIITAGPARLRPILMTTLTTVLGLVPLSLGIGEGGELGAPMAVSVIGGLTFSTLLTLIVIPVVYTIFEDWGDILARYRKRRQKPAGAQGA